MFDSDHRKRERDERASGEYGASSWMSLSARHARAGQTVQALECARKALEKAPTNRTVRLWMKTLGMSRGPWPSRFGGADNACSSRLRGAREGRMVWSLAIEGAAVGLPIQGPRGSIFVTTSIGHLLTIHPEGRVTHKEPHWCPGILPTLASSGRLLVACRERGLLSSNYLSAFPDNRRPGPETLESALYDPFSDRSFTAFGGHLWDCAPKLLRAMLSLSTPGPDWAQPVPAFDKEGRIYVGSVKTYAGEIVCCEPNGTLIWSFAARSPMAGPAIAALSEHGVVARIGDSIYSLDDNGEVRWQRKTHMADWWRIPYGGDLPPATVFEDRALLATSWGVVAVDIESGREIFQRLDLRTTNAMAIDAEGVAHISVPGRLLGIDRRGETVYQVKLPGRGVAAGAPMIGYGGRTLVLAPGSLLALE